MIIHVFYTAGRRLSPGTAAKPEKTIISAEAYIRSTDKPENAAGGRRKAR